MLAGITIDLKEALKTANERICFNYELDSNEIGERDSHEKAL
jgi:hypothetical protein